MKKIVVHILMIIMTMSTLAGCQFTGLAKDDEDNITVYFYNEQTSLLEGEKVPYEAGENDLSEDKMVAVIEALYEGPKSKGQINKPIDFHIKEATLKGNRAYIDFEGEYNQLAVKQQMITRASIVWSITEIEYIEEVEFLVEGEPLKTSSGSKVGVVSRQDILINVLDPSPPTSIQVITLYFPKAGDDKLYKEERPIQVNSNVPLEKHIIHELIKGPETEGLLPILPSDTKLNDIKTQEGICQVDLSYALNTSQNTTPVKESLVMYSIVNSLTELTTIKKVLFLKDGQKQTEFSTDITTSGTFERNEEIIANTP